MWIGAGERRDVDDVTAAALFHLRDRFVTTIEHAKQIRLEHRAKIFGRGLLDSLKDTDTGVVDENIEPAQFFDCMIYERFHLIIVAYITNQTYRATIFGSIQLVYCLVDFVLMPSANANRYAFANQGLSDSTADAFGAAGDDCDFVVEIHCSEFRFNLRH